MKKTSAGKECRYEAPRLEVIEIQFQRIMDGSPLENVEDGEEHGWDEG